MPARKTKRVQSRTRPKTPAPERENITSRLVFTLLKDEPSTAGLRADDDCIKKAADALLKLQVWVRLHESPSWQRSTDTRELLVRALQTISKIAPVLDAELEEALGWHNAEGRLDASYEAADARRMLDALLRHVDRISYCAILYHPATRHSPILRWALYADLIVDALNANFQAISREATYRFLVAVTPYITGETVTFQAVKTQMKQAKPLSHTTPAKRRPVGQTHT